MSGIKSKVAYIQGLLDGLTIADEATEKVFKAILKTLEDMAEIIEEHDECIDELDDCMEDICDELDDIDEYLFDDDDDEEDECDFFEAECPSCGEMIYFDNQLCEKMEELICPNCNTSIIQDIEEDDEDEE